MYSVFILELSSGILMASAHQLASHPGDYILASKALYRKGVMSILNSFPRIFPP